MIIPEEQIEEGGKGQQPDPDRMLCESKRRIKYAFIHRPQLSETERGGKRQVNQVETVTLPYDCTSYKAIYSGHVHFPTSIFNLATFREYFIGASLLWSVPPSPCLCSSQMGVIIFSFETANLIVAGNVCTQFAFRSESECSRIFF